MDFEDLLEAVGGYGTYQKRMVYIFLIPISLTVPFLCMNQIFMLSIPPHGCYEPTVSSYLNLSEQDRVDLVRPPNTDIALGTTHDSCNMYNISYDTVMDDMLRMGMNVSQYVANSSGTWSTVPCQHGWDYDKSLYSRTVVTDWNLVCDQSSLISMVYTVTTLGSAVGTPIFGWLSDRIGRRLTFLITSVIGVVSSVLSVTIPNFIAFTVVRTINGALLPSVFQLPYLILVEIVAPEMRTRMNGVACILWTMGLALMPLIAWLTADWIAMGWVSAACSLPYVAYYWFLPESPRWLISKDRYEEASQTLARLAKVNKKDVSHLDMVSILKKCSHREREASKNEQQASPLELVTNPNIRKRFFFICMSWIADSMTYYMFHINISSLYGNEFMNFFLLALVEFPSYLVAWFLMETKLGRRWSNVLFLLLTGVVCILPAMAPSGTATFMTVASLVGKFGVSASFMVMYQQSAEIFPTPLRASGMGIAGTIASVISIATPYIIYLSTYSRHIPYTVMAAICLAAGICALFIPETLNEHLPQTIHDGETFGTTKSFFSFANPEKPEPNEHVRSLSMDYTNSAEMRQFAADHKNVIA